ncbi:MAG: AAA family ATPase [Desulfohalobiaceae bacterium]
MTNDEMQSKISAVIETAGQVVLGKEKQVRLSLACLLARGHLLIEDLPGIGKTTLAHALARLLGLEFQRVQFTSDLLPGDVLGVSVFEQDTGSFAFHPGPVFSQVVLVDEINRATPKTQSALLESMEEGQVTIEGRTRPLPRPFFVMATQNPLEQAGTFPLPESQLDRFLMRISLGYPDRASEKALLTGPDRREQAAELAPVLGAQEIMAIQARVVQVHASDALVSYVQDLMQFSRRSGHFLNGLSPRAGLALVHSAQAMAFMDTRDYLLPEDVQEVLPWVVSHRLVPAAGDTAFSGRGAPELLLENVPVP